MNKRIRQILLQVVPMAGEDGEYLPSLHTPEDIEQFAELIVRECIDKISQEQDIAEQNWQCKNGLHICHELTKHFGVEE
jgi:hypothetical protein